MKIAKHSLKNFFFAIALAFSAIFSFSSCNGSTAISGIHMSKEEVIDVPYGNFSYEGVMVTVDYVNGTSTEIQLEESMISEYEKLKFFKMGKQDVIVNLRNRYETTMKINVVLNKFNDVYALEGYECVYDGLPHSVKLNHELPEGATITYPYGNVFSNAGTYTITGVISKKGYESKTLTTTLTILQAERDASGIKFEDKTVTYTGEMVTMEATGVPKGIEVNYEYRNSNNFKVNKVVNAGEYKVYAHFIDENTNYKQIPDLEATLIIEKATYDMSQIELKDHTKEYDGEEYAASITNSNLLPTGVSVNYKYFSESGLQVKSNAKAGKYTVVAEFVGGDALNYNPIEPLTATLTVAKRVIKISDKISFESETVDFDYQDHSILIKGELPDTVEVTYENNGNKYVGEYLITAKFKAKNENDAVDVEELTAYLVINRIRSSVPMLNSETQKYTEEFSKDPAKYIKITKTATETSADVIGYDTDVYNLVFIKFFLPNNSDLVEPSKLVDGVTYEYLVSFEFNDENLQNSVILAIESGLYTYSEA